MKNKFVSNLLSSGLQAMSVQLLGGAFFYFISIYASKSDFGLIGWANAISAFLVSILSFGMEQVVVRRVASSSTSDWAAFAYFVHAAIASFATLCILFLLSLLHDGGINIFYVLPWFFCTQALSFIASPIRQFLNAKDKYAPYGVIALVSNIAKLAAIISLSTNGSISIATIAGILIGFSAFELVAVGCYVLFFSKIPVQLTFKTTAYKKLVKESAPQFLSVIFDSSLSRMDWILLGMLSTNVVVAEYSFAYRAYEIARLPLSIIGPVILTKYAKMLSVNQLSEKQAHETRRFYVLEIFAAGALLIIMNLLWSPLVSLATDGKYGSSNFYVFFIISLCMPFHFIINLLWTLAFASRKYKYITTTAMAIAICNIVLNLILIPLYGALGAAIAYLLSMGLQAIVYLQYVTKGIIRLSPIPLFVQLVIYVVSFCCGFLLFSAIYLQMIVALAIYFLLSMLLKQINRADVSILMQYIKKQ